MICPHCNNPATLVQTSILKDYSTERHWMCPYRHEFKTVEVYQQVYKSFQQRATVFGKTIARWHAQWERNRDVVVNWSKGAEHFMVKYGMSRTGVYNARRAGKLGSRFTTGWKLRAIEATPQPAACVGSDTPRTFWQSPPTNAAQ